MFCKNLNLIIGMVKMMVFSPMLFAHDHPLMEKTTLLLKRQSLIPKDSSEPTKSVEPELDLSPTTPEEAYKVLGLREHQRTQADIRKAFFDLGMQYTLKKGGLGPQRLKNINQAHKILKTTAFSQP